MKEFGDWLMEVPEKKPSKVELNTRREMLTSMMDDMNRMLTDCDVAHPDDSYERYSIWGPNEI